MSLDPKKINSPTDCAYTALFEIKIHGLYYGLLNFTAIFLCSNNSFAGDWTIGWEPKASRTGREQPHNKHASVSIAATRVSGFGDVERDR